MPDHLTLIRILGAVAVASPACLLIVLGLPSLFGRSLSEWKTNRAAEFTLTVGCLATVAAFALMVANGAGHVPLDLGNWVSVPHYHFTVKFVFDWLSVPFLILSFVLCGIVGAFSSRYMHREPGYTRFFVLFALFVLGMAVTSVADTIETLFTGWELVGLSSALLVAFFHERPAPCRNGLRVWVVYRVSDAALLLAAVVIHHLTGEGDFDQLFGTGPWPAGHTSVSESQALLVGSLLLIAAAGKSALVPFSGWLPRAMEGPTPTSAVFYGALSVHLGAFLLLRFGPLLEAAPALGIAITALGLVTAVYAAIVGSVQTDIKSALCFASLAQVGLIVAEVGLGWNYLALTHLIGHACLRTLQFLRAPTLLQDTRNLENAIGGRVPRAETVWGWLIPPRIRGWVYRLALERGSLDAILNDYVAAPFVRLFRWFDRLERCWTDFLAGRSRREPPPPPSEGIEELV